MSYIDYEWNDSKAFTDAFDEAPLWSAAFGLFLLKHLKLQGSKQVLDIGCGTGFPLFELAGRLGTDAQLTGIDPWHNAIKRAERKLQEYKYQHVTLVEADAAQLPLADAETDLIVSNLGINNFSNANAVYQECYRVLKPGGRLALTTNIYGHWNLFYEIFEQVLQTHNLPKEKEVLQQQQLHRGTAAEHIKTLEHHGFRIIKTAGDNLEMEFANGTAFFHHHFIQPGWLGSWLNLIDTSMRERVFNTLETALNQYAAEHGSLVLQVPMLYLEAVKA